MRSTCDTLFRAYAVEGTGFRTPRFPLGIELRRKMGVFSFRGSRRLGIHGFPESGEEL